MPDDLFFRKGTDHWRLPKSRKWREWIQSQVQVFVPGHGFDLSLTESESWILHVKSHAESSRAFCSGRGRD